MKVQENRRGGGESLLTLSTPPFAPGRKTGYKSNSQSIGLNQSFKSISLLAILQQPREEGSTLVSPNNELV